MAKLPKGGLEEEKILKTIEKFSQKLPKFPDGRINYSDSDVAPVITVFVRYNDEILLLKRGDKVRVYQRKWNTVAGYLDQVRPIREKILEELREEVEVELKEISSIQLGKPFRFKDRKIGKTWLIHPVLVILGRKPKIKLDWEHTEFKWIRPDDLKSFDLVPNLVKSFQNASLD